MAQQVEERIHAAAGLAGQRVTLLRLPRYRRGVVIGPPSSVDTLIGLVTHGHQQRRLAGGELAQLCAVQRAQRGITVEHPQHRVACGGGWAVRFADPQAVMALAVGRIQVQLAEAVGQVLALQQ
ncbi:hypothetical protein D3C79_908520 [compost metagenome]